MSIYVASLKGKRPQNEDTHFISENLNGSNSNASNVDFCAIFDGHGGSGVSEILAKTLPHFFVKKSIKYPISNKYIGQVYDEVQEMLKTKRKKLSQECGSTALISLRFIDDNSEWLTILNTGDSRCVLCRDNIALPLTKDHKPSWPEENNRITKLGGKIVSDGYDLRIGSLSVSRAFGDLDATPYVTHTPEIFKYKIEKKDKFIILACDGLWDVLECQDAVNYILYSCYDSTLTRRINKKDNVAEKLGEFAIKKGSLDNITIIVLFM